MGFNEHIDIGELNELFSDFLHHNCVDSSLGRLGHKHHLVFHICFYYLKKNLISYLPSDDRRHKKILKQN